MAAISTRHGAVAVEFTDGRTGARITRQFGMDAIAARRCFAAKLKAGREPKVVKGADDAK